MHISAAPGLKTVGLDVKAVASSRGADLPQHPLLPPHVLQFTRYWMNLAATTRPSWTQFEMMDVADIVPYLTVLRCEPDSSFTFTFTGSAVSAILGEDLTGRTVSLGTPVWGEIDWYRRCKPVAEVADIQVLSGSMTPAHMSAIDFVAADFPFMDDTDGAVSYIVGVTVARLN